MQIAVSDTIVRSSLCVGSNKPNLTRQEGSAQSSPYVGSLVIDIEAFVDLLPIIPMRGEFSLICPAKASQPYVQESSPYLESTFFDKRQTHRHINYLYMNGEYNLRLIERVKTVSIIPCVGEHYE